MTGLREPSGARLVTYLGGLKETRAVWQWAAGVREIRDPVDRRRLRLALQVAGLSVDRDGPVVA